jgi:hypothetical protein
MTMVTQAVKKPSSFAQYLSPDKSPLNPYNAGYDFFVYGTLPLKIVKFASTYINFDKFSYNNVTLVGRLLSAIVDIGVVLIIFKVGQKTLGKLTGILSSFLYAISTLPIQLSHFYAVDPYLVFFTTFSFYLLVLLIEGEINTTRRIKTAIGYSLLLGVCFGLALASKISALLFTPVVLLGLAFMFLKKRDVLQTATYLLLIIISTYLSFRLVDPRAFSDANFLNAKLNANFISNITQLKSFSNPNSLFPPSVQWIKTKPLLFPFKNIILWGLGLPLGIIATAAVIYTLTKILFSLKHLKKLKDEQIYKTLIIFWILSLFFYQGTQFVKTMRYFYPIYPFLAIVSADYLLIFSKKAKQIIKSRFFLFTIYSITLLLLLIWPLSFVSIYSRPHTRVSASKWIYENIPPGSTLSCEHWDDCLPLSLEGKSHSLYEIETLELYNPDTQTKWVKINKQLENIDYLILSSNRLWESIPKVPERYPVASEFYKNLFSSELQFTKIAEFASYPTLKIGYWKLKIPDDRAEEAFSVYDHPKVIIFKQITDQ